MKWVVAAIVVFAAGYTAVNFYFRKKGPAFKPYEDMNNRATTARLLNAGWQKAAVDARRPTEKPGFILAATVRRGAPGLGPELEAAFAEKPRLLASIDRVTAADQVKRGTAYPIYFNASLTDQGQQLGALELLRRDHEIVLLPSAEKLPGGGKLLSRWPESDYCTEIPTDGLAPGRYEVRILSRGPAAQWSFEVR